MSLKNFHLLFVVIATLTVLFCGIEALAAYRASGQAVMAAVAIGALVTAALLVRIETLFLRQCRRAGVR
jgi:hypothetical protein